VRSDPVGLHVNRGDELRVDLYLPEAVMHSTGNHTWTPMQVSLTGNYVGSPTLPTIPTPTIAGPDTGVMPIPLPYLHSVEVHGPPAGAVVACLGDSITSGWPEQTAALLKGRIEVAMLNMGIAGNRLCTDAGPSIASYGRSGLSRLEDDVLDVTGVTDLVIALGTNDLGLPGTAAPLNDLPSAAQLIEAHAVLIDRATQAGLRVTLATTTPFMPAKGYDHRRDDVRTTVNDWIRSHAPNVADFDAAVRSASSPDRLDASLDCGDHLHPNDDGKRRLAHTMAAAMTRTLHLAPHPDPAPHRSEPEA
jgi:lysophospholipase L1-like esterase